MPALLAETAISVIVASRHRPGCLSRCIASLCQQDHPHLEIVIVADPASVEAVARTGLRAKLIAFDEPNLSDARNLGLVAAAGEIVAFIDDDAVAEPGWARRLGAAFDDSSVMQAGGYVRGRNGFSYQSTAVLVDRTGQDHPLPASSEISVHAASALGSVKTQGTNCAFRRDALLAAGGFDPALRFYLDDADVNLRFGRQGSLAAIVPQAEVHHLRAASVRRRTDRAPLTLHDIGASTAVFLRRHAPDEIDTALWRLREDQRRRLVGMLVDGKIAPGDLPHLRATLEAGIADGLARVLPPLAPLADREQAWLGLDSVGPRPGCLLGGWIWQRRHLMLEARSQRAAGRIVTVLLLAPGRRPHRQQMTDDGIWVQTGGVHGPAERSEPRIRLFSLSGRIWHETTRIARQRPVDDARTY